MIKIRKVGDNLLTEAVDTMTCMKEVEEIVVAVMDTTTYNIQYRVPCIKVEYERIPLYTRYDFIKDYIEEMYLTVLVEDKPVKLHPLKKSDFDKLKDWAINNRGSLFIKIAGAFASVYNVPVNNDDVVRRVDSYNNEYTYILNNRIIRVLDEETYDGEDIAMKHFRRHSPDGLFFEVSLDADTVIVGTKLADIEKYLNKKGESLWSMALN